MPSSRWRGGYGLYGWERNRRDSPYNEHCLSDDNVHGSPIWEIHSCGFLSYSFHSPRCCRSAPPGRKATTPKKELEKFQGDWQVLSSEEDGFATPEFIVQNLKLTIKGDVITLKGVDGLKLKFGKVKLTVDPASNPKLIDFKVEAGSEKDNLYEGIYELKDGKLKICASTRTGGNRPDEFKTKADSNRVLFVLKREKP
ncbi:MAG: TIGR03067 domain-containing protein [Planctomycetes bacterium]|nr:TIGR03067 domain-containing protein [Planctomycetota bacterium]